MNVIGQKPFVTTRRGKSDCHLTIIKEENKKTAREKVQFWLVYSSDLGSTKSSNLFQLSAVEKKKNPDYVRADLRCIRGPLRILKVCVQSLRRGSRVSL